MTHFTLLQTMHILFTYEYIFEQFCQECTKNVLFTEFRNVFVTEWYEEPKGFGKENDLFGVF